MLANQTLNIRSNSKIIVYNIVITHNLLNKRPDIQKNIDFYGKINFRANERFSEN
jgi:hypothetical protein